MPVLHCHRLHFISQVNENANKEEVNEGDAYHPKKRRRRLVVSYCYTLVLSGGIVPCMSLTFKFKNCLLKNLLLILYVKYVFQVKLSHKHHIFDQHF